MKHSNVSRHTIALLAALLFAAVIPFGCSSGDDVVEGPVDGDVTPTDGDEDNDPVDIDTMDIEDQQPDGDKDDDIDDTEPVEIDSEGPFIHCPTTLSMGYVNIGEPVMRSFSCQNLGTEALTVYEITMVQGAREEFELVDPPPPVRNVPVQGSFSQDINYGPVDPGTDCATVTVVSNAVNDPTFTIEVCSEYKGDPAIDVNPTAHDFGEVVPNSTPLVRTITIKNPQEDPQANAVLVIDQISNESGSTADFEPVVTDSFPIYVNADGEYTFEIQFHPSRVTPEPLSDKIIISHNADVPPVEIVVSGRAAVPIIECGPVDEQNNINWGQIKAGTSVEKILSCENIGGSTLHIRDIKLSDSTDAEFTEHDTVGPAGAFLARGAPIDIYLTYSPVNLGVNQGQIIIESNDETTPQLRISLLGAAIDSRLTAIPASVNYGEVVVGESEAQSFTLRNDGQAPVKILDLSFGENEQEFTVPVSVMQTVINTTLGHLEAIDVEVLYSPVDAGVDSRMLQVISDDSHNPTLDVTLNGIGLAAKIGISCPEHPLFDTEGIDFDEVALGQSVNTDCYITNLGTTDMNITVDITGQTPQEEFWVVQEAFLPTPPGESKILTLRYTPLLVEGEDLGVVTVYANDPQIPRWDIDLRGMAVNPDIMVVPITSETQAYDFGPHLVGSQTTMPFYISNTGSMGDLVIYSVEFTETSDDAFRFEWAEQLPVSIGPGGSRSLGVVFRPLAESSFAAQLQITSNDLDEQVSTIYLAGTGESCPDGWWDIDGNPTNGPLGDGCEYRCDLSDPPYELCDNIDNDCDGVTDPPNAIDNCPPRNHSTVMCDAGACEYTCDSDFHQCGDECVYDGNTQNCGSSCTPCDVPEFAIPSCTIGGGGEYQCGFDCIAGYREHEGVCKRENSPECCGPDCIECLNPPQGGYLACEEGMCTPKCESGDHLCGAQCVDNYSTDHCGSSCLPCADPENGQATCNGLECGVVCNAFFHPQGDECVLNNTTDCCGFECTACPPNTATKISVCDNYYCDFQCVPGSHRCSNECLYDDDPDHCGTNCWPCFQPPHSEAQCSRPSTSDPWACSFECDQGFHAEGDYCFANDSDPAHCGLNDRDCGSCCTPQHAIPLCIEGECDFACEIGYHRCDDQCYDDYDAAHCMVGESCQACPTVPHALSTCTPQLWQDPCGYTCYQGYLDLNGDPADGCEYTCEPSGDTDLPDDMFVDTNCDGIDGTVDQAVFVSHTGNDMNPGTRDRPKRSIQAAINTTYSTPSRKYVLVSEGIYEESITLKGGVSVFGGYSQSANWTRSTAYKAIIQGIDPITVEARGISVPTEIAWMEIRGKNFSSDGISSYAVYAIDSSSNLRFNNCTIIGGQGGNGENGIDGAEAGVSGNRGGNGEAGSEDTCNTGDGGTGGGYSPCGTGRSGGGGGCGSGDGASGYSTYGCSGGPGGHGVGNCWEEAGNGTAGGDGRDGDDGNAGSNGNTTGNISYSFWVGQNGGAGQDGDSGTAGCGGGGGGGGDGWILCSNDSGGGGGQGGGAGCGGDAGLGGHPGGGSFAMFLVNAHVTIASCTIRTEGGGDGGDGGLGQAGGNGGSGGSGGAGFDSSGDGGAGGRGGNGGHGGRGGGGGGGVSVGIYKAGSSNPVIDPLTMQYDIGPGGDAGNNGDQALTEEIYP